MTIESLLSEILQQLKMINGSLKIKEEKSLSLPLPKRFLTVKEWVKNHSWPSESGLRNIIFNKSSFKAENCIKKVGRRVLIDEAEFLKWIETNPSFKFHVEKMLTR